jgi:hypothetical protein
MRVTKYHDPPSGPHELFESLITNLIMEGGDADTNGAVAGALLGAWLGYSRFPAHWAEGLAHKEWLAHKTHRLLVALGIVEGELLAEDDEKPDGPKGLRTAEELQTMEREFIAMLLGKEKLRREKREAEERKKKVGNWFKSTLL